MPIWSGDMNSIPKALEEAGISPSSSLCFTIGSGVITIEKRKIHPTDARKLALGFIYKHMRNYSTSFTNLYNVGFTTTVCTVFYNGRIVVGHAVCPCEEDYYLEIGKALALSRAIKVPLPAELQSFIFD